MKNLFRLIALFRPVAPWMGASLLISTATSLANIALLALSGWFVAAMGLAGVAGTAINYFTPAAVIRALAIIRTGGRYLERLVSHDAALRQIAVLRGSLFAALEPLIPGAVDDIRSGDAATRLGADVERLEQIFLRLLSPLTAAALTSLATVAALACLSGSMALILGGALLCAALLVPFPSIRFGRSHGWIVAETTARLRSRLSDDLEGLETLLSSNAAPLHMERLRQNMDELLAAEIRLSRTGALGQAAVAAIGDGAAIAVLALGIALTTVQDLSGPALPMVVLATLATFEALAGLPEAFAAAGSVLASARRIFALIDRQPLVADPSCSDGASPAPSCRRLDIVLDSLGLTYPNAQTPALRDIDMTIEEGARIAFVGPSGAGKSSLKDLLLRFRDPSSGSIRLGETPINRIALDVLRAHIAAVPQFPHLFTATIAENLRYARPDASPEEMRSVLDIAQMSALIETLPQGLDTPAGAAGTQLSGGERRRLAIARTLLLPHQDRSVLILDEPSEGLDPETEQRLFDALLAHIGKRTLILFTHRPGVLARMDKIVVLSEGRVVEAGSYDALLAKGKVFPLLFEHIADS